MSYMSEYSQQQEDRENLSGLDDYEAWIASMESEFKETAPQVKVATAYQTDSDLKPF